MYVQCFFVDANWNFSHFFWTIERTLDLGDGARIHISVTLDIDLLSLFHPLHFLFLDSFVAWCLI